uniref:Venom s1 protease 21 n=1 Tax=Pristhesancus plagipennis TaxID=1955184 RepID=A0A1Q1NPG6_PRIPG|nr:venom s1 protease 21 [Pristhesancus plagipennis]
MKFLNIYFVVISVISLRAAAAEEDSSEYGVIPGARGTTCPCGHLNKNQARIIGGGITEPNEFPFMAGIRTEKSPFVFCGGVIISAFHVLTAAHCTDARPNERLKVIVGDHDVYNPRDNSHAVELSVKKIIEHERFDKKGEMEDDIAILVTEKIAFNNFITPICFPNEKVNLVGQTVKVLGWGKISPHGPYSEVLRKVNLHVVDIEECDEYFNAIDKIAHSQICTKTPHADSCQGDSGGPLIWRDPATNRYTLVGIISFGDLCSNEDAPAVNTDVYFHRDWIKQKMAETRPNGRTCSKN